MGELFHVSRRSREFGLSLSSLVEKRFLNLVKGVDYPSYSVRLRHCRLRSTVASDHRDLFRLHVSGSYLDPQGYSFHLPLVILPPGSILFAIVDVGPYGFLPEAFRDVISGL